MLTDFNSSLKFLALYKKFMVAFVCVDKNSWTLNHSSAYSPLIKAQKNIGIWTERIGRS